ncbi:MAG: hypothetical protein JNM62_10200 [Flavobacteriales bacterium]|nr:hypothetical protein [Flavobacteriales bacterium]
MKTTYIGASGKSYEFVSVSVADRNKLMGVVVVAVLVKIEGNRSTVLRVSYALTAAAALLSQWENPQFAPRVMGCTHISISRPVDPDEGARIVRDLVEAYDPELS